MKANPCSICHAPIPANAPGGFCPACLLRDAEEPAPSDNTAPSLEEIAAAFPQFEVIKLIGQGGMGFVYQVRQPGLDRTVALKILAPEFSRDPAFAERFAREARVLGKLSHPNIVTVFEHVLANGRLVTVGGHRFDHFTLARHSSWPPSLHRGSGIAASLADA